MEGRMPFRMPEITSSRYFLPAARNLSFFSSRRRHTRWTGDWRSDVCSSDLSSQHRRSRFYSYERYSTLVNNEVDRNLFHRPRRLDDDGAVGPIVVLVRRRVVAAVHDDVEAIDAELELDEAETDGDVADELQPRLRRVLFEHHVVGDGHH